MKSITKGIFEINISESLEYISTHIINILFCKMEEYKKIYNVNNFRNLTINIFDDKEKFRNFIYEIRKSNTLPEYATWTFDKGMINLYIDISKLKDNNNYYNHAIHTPAHELFHIMYKEIILKNDYKKRIIWFDEGMAQFMSGELDLLNDDKKFYEFYIKTRETTKEIPLLNEIDHGKSFVNDKYNGYKLSYLSIKYLNEILDKKEFVSLIHDFDKINNR